jgi:hypothetical protein
LAQDSQGHYGHTVFVVQSFVDSQLFRGTAYKSIAGFANRQPLRDCWQIRRPEPDAPFL